MKNYIKILILLIIIGGCSQKENEGDKKFISILSLIEKQVAHIDTSLYSIMKIEIIDSLHNDTTYIPREEFRAAAKEFLVIPDLSLKNVAKRYKEEPAQYDELMNRVIITYTPIDPKKEEIKKQEILVTPNTSAGDNVTNIIITKVISNKDSFLQKNMLWQMDKSFQVITTTQKPGKPEIVKTVKVSWNEDSY